MSIELNTKNVWIFQANPEAFDIIKNERNEGALSDPEYSWDFWKVKQHETEIKKDDLAIIWVAGYNGGVYAFGDIVSNPKSTDEYNPVCDKYERENKAGKKLMEESKDMKILKVKIEHTLRFSSYPLLKGACRRFTPDLSVISQPQGTNFDVKPEEWKIILEQTLRNMADTLKIEGSANATLFANKATEIFPYSIYQKELYDLGDILPLFSKIA